MRRIDLAEQHPVRRHHSRGGPLNTAAHASAPPIRLVVADDHPIVRAGLIALLTPEHDIDVVGEASNGTDAVAVALRERPDVVLCDLRMPGLDGVGVTQALSEQLPSTLVVILTTYETDDAIVPAIAAGAKGYLVKAAPADELLAGIRAVATGEVALSPQVATRLVAHLQGYDATPPNVSAEPTPLEALLSPREIEVLALVGAGLRNAQLAAHLSISEPTVKTHLLRTYQKLGVNDRTRAVIRAMELGLPQPPRL